MFWESENYNDIELLILFLISIGNLLFSDDNH